MFFDKIESHGFDLLKLSLKEKALNNIVVDIMAMEEQILFLDCAIESFEEGINELIFNADFDYSDSDLEKIKENFRRNICLEEAERKMLQQSIFDKKRLMNQIISQK